MISCFSTAKDTPALAVRVSIKVAASFPSLLKNAIVYPRDLSYYPVLFAAFSGRFAHNIDMI